MPGKALTKGQQHVRSRELEIAQALTNCAIQSGSYQLAKFLFEYAELMPEKRARSEEEEELPGPSLAEMVLAKLRDMEESGGGTAASENV